MQDRYRHPRQHGGDDVGLAECAATLHHREQEALEPSGRFVQGLLQGVEEVHVELLVLVDVVPDAVQEDHLHEAPDDGGFRRHEYPGSLVAGVWRPVVGLRQLDYVFPVRYRR